MGILPECEGGGGGGCDGRLLEGGGGGGRDTVLTGGGGGLILPFCILVSSRDTGCMGSGVLSLGPGPMVAGGRC